MSQDNVELARHFVDERVLRSLSSAGEQAARLRR
jgi:hypothetical protein